MSLLDAALADAARGWMLLPLWWPQTFGAKRGPDRAGCACGHGDCESQGKHPVGTLAPHGLDDATRDPEVIRAWFARFPRLNIGARTGITFDALDIDSQAALDALVAYQAGRPMTWGPTSWTGGGGWHLLHQPTGAGNRAAMLGVPGLDWRGRGGFIVLPGSLHRSGRRYEWAVGEGPDEPPEPVPEWLADLVLRRTGERPVRTATRPRAGMADAGAERALNEELGRLLATPESSRNNALCRAAFNLAQLVRLGRLDETTVVSSLLLAASRVGLGDREAEQTIKSGFKGARAKPRRMAS